MSLRVMLYLGSLYASHEHAFTAYPGRSTACLPADMDLDPDRLPSCHAVQYRKFVELEVILCSIFSALQGLSFGPVER